MHLHKKEITNTVPTETEWEFIYCALKLINLQNNVYNEVCILMPVKGQIFSCNDLY